jgi:prepilin-type N-terminal cleavage/methylation domain-containing protein
MDKSKRGVSLIESLVCIVIIGIGFIAIMQLSAFTINSMDRATEKNKLNFLSEMVMEDMIGDTDNASKYSFQQTACSYSNPSGSNLYTKKMNKWRDKISEKNFIKIGNQNKKPRCKSGDSKKTFIKQGDSKTTAVCSNQSDAGCTTGRVNFLTGKLKKYLGVVIK